jgi:hypothetical protein
MSSRNCLVALAALMAIIGLTSFLQGRADSTAQNSGPDTVEELKKLRAACDMVALQNKELGDQLLKLRREHEAVRDDHKKGLKDLNDLVAANKTLFENGLAGLKKHFDDQNLRVEWRRQSIGVTPEAGQDQEIDFGKPVVEAVAIVTRFHFRYPRNDDHHVRQMIAEAEVIEIKGNKVKIKCHAWMDDNSGNRSDRFGMTYVVIARIKS